MLSRFRKDGRRGGPVTFDAQAGLLSARVRDEQGRPVAGSEMVMQHKRTQRRTSVVSDEFGLAVSTLSAGTYTVSVSADGYDGVTHTVDVGSGDHTALGEVPLRRNVDHQLPAPGEWELDQDHTSIRFVARHIGLSQVHGRFTGFRGIIRVGDRPEDSSVEVSIDAASIDTASEKRDAHLRSPDFLDVERFPRIHFFGNRFRRTPGDRWVIDGTLTIRGASRGVQLDAGYLGLRSWEGDRLGALATAQLHREDYTINWQRTLAKGLVVVGSTVEILLDVQAIRG
ncbi:MAG TPA: YceI family protein [Amycolatopsis sp.]|jgi:polyisoprenoid-binding protein YceI|nr:YceI family protein [Amycolatopsis sp.]